MRCNPSPYRTQPLSGRAFKLLVTGTTTLFLWAMRCTAQNAKKNCNDKCNFWFSKVGCGFSAQLLRLDYFFRYLSLSLLQKHFNTMRAISHFTPRRNVVTENFVFIRKRIIQNNSISYTTTIRVPCIILISICMQSHLCEAKCTAQSTSLVVCLLEEKLSWNFSAILLRVLLRYAEFVKAFSNPMHIFTSSINEPIAQSDGAHIFCILSVSSCLLKIFLYFYWNMSCISIFQFKLTHKSLSFN